MLAVRVPRRDAEKIRREAERIGAKDKRRLITQNGEFVEIPILKEFAGYFKNYFKNYEIVVQENPVFTEKKDLRSVLRNKIPSNLHGFIPRRYKIIGDIALVKIPEEIEMYSREIGEAIMKLHPRIKAVWRDYGREGMLRKPRVELIAGNGSETVHRENGCLFKLDVTKVMYSVGNQGEKMRVAKMVRDGEVVVDMFAGIGYFSIPVAVHSNPSKIYAIEINPDSYHYLLENIKLNKADVIIPILGDSMKVTPEGVADRVIMGHLFCHDFLRVAIRAVGEEGVIHYHESTPEAVINRPVERVKKACEKEGRKCEVLGMRKVKNYSPGVYHVVVDFRVS